VVNGKDRGIERRAASVSYRMVPDKRSDPQVVCRLLEIAIPQNHRLRAQAMLRFAGIDA
jgi:hypothetical protein